MFIDAHVAARIERVESRLSRAVAVPIAGARIIEIAGGTSVFARVGSPVNKVIGVGFDGPVDLAPIEPTWDEPVRVELATLASPAAAASLIGYQLMGFENVLVRALGDVPAPPIDVGTNDDAAWMRVLVEGFAAGDGTGAQVDHYARAAIEQVMRDFGAAEGFRRYVARLDNVAGAASMFIDDGIAILAGAATLPAARRRGVQAALLAARLRDARDAGCELAVITTAPGSLSQKNAMRSGFVLAYARAVLQRTERV
jgi:GNAT superfamily N-acetyltransferase